MPNLASLREDLFRELAHAYVKIITRGPASERTSTGHWRTPLDAKFRACLLVLTFGWPGQFAFFQKRGAIRTSDVERHSHRGRWPADYSNEQGQRLAMRVRPMAIDRSTAAFDGTDRDA